MIRAGSAVDEVGQALAEATVPNDRAGLAALPGWLAEHEVGRVGP